MTGQSRRHSALEAVANVAIGYGVALVSQWAVFPMFGIHVGIRDNLVASSTWGAVKAMYR